MAVYDNEILRSKDMYAIVNKTLSNINFWNYSIAINSSSGIDDNYQFTYDFNGYSILLQVTSYSSGIATGIKILSAIPSLYGIRKIVKTGVTTTPVGNIATLLIDINSTSVNFYDIIKNIYVPIQKLTDDLNLDDSLKSTIGFAETVSNDDNDNSLTITLSKRNASGISVGINTIQMQESLSNNQIFNKFTIANNTYGTSILTQSPTELLFYNSSDGVSGTGTKVYRKKEFDDRIVTATQLSTLMTTLGILETAGTYNNDPDQVISNADLWGILKDLINEIRNTYKFKYLSPTDTVSSWPGESVGDLGIVFAQDTVPTIYIWNGINWIENTSIKLYPGNTIYTEKYVTSTTNFDNLVPAIFNITSGTNYTTTGNLEYTGLEIPSLRRYILLPNTTDYVAYAVDISRLPELYDTATAKALYNDGTQLIEYIWNGTAWIVGSTAYSFISGDVYIAKLNPYVIKYSDDPQTIGERIVTIQEYNLYDVPTWVGYVAFTSDGFERIYVDFLSFTDYAVTQLDTKPTNFTYYKYTSNILTVTTTVLTSADMAYIFYDTWGGTWSLTQVNASNVQFTKLTDGRYPTKGITIYITNLNSSLGELSNPYLQADLAAENMDNGTSWLTVAEGYEDVVLEQILLVDKPGTTSYIPVKTANNIVPTIPYATDSVPGVIRLDTAGGAASYEDIEDINAELVTKADQISSDDENKLYRKIVAIQYTPVLTDAYFTGNALNDTYTDITGKTEIKVATLNGTTAATFSITSTAEVYIAQAGAYILNMPFFLKSSTSQSAPSIIWVNAQVDSDATKTIQNLIDVAEKDNILDLGITSTLKSSTDQIYRIPDSLSQNLPVNTIMYFDEFVTYAPAAAIGGTEATISSQLINNSMPNTFVILVVPNKDTTNDTIVASQLQLWAYSGSSWHRTSDFIQNCNPSIFISGHTVDLQYTRVTYIYSESDGSGGLTLVHCRTITEGSGGSISGDLTPITDDEMNAILQSAGLV